MLNSKDAGTGREQPSPPASSDSKIKVKAILHCSNCGYHKTFSRMFDRKDLDQLVVSAKVMSWSACECGELVEFSLEVEF
ncbi:MAG: hypothetical protein GYA24_23780 [Candidatus Lokiarchaeota archaeon]|nr:hypothetical protein [Candidatus Lokiarchaeota archaeon]